MPLRILVLVAALTLSARGEVLIPFASQTEWRYQTEEPDAKHWRAPEFDDSAWPKGKGPLGYGRRNLGTDFKSATSGNKKPGTAWFRHRFDVPETSAGEKALMLSLRVDDGAAVYLNGKEIARVNLPADAGPQTPATRPIRDWREQARSVRLPIASAQLLKGSNSLAVEVHQAAGDQTDLLLDLSLRTGSLPPEGSAALTDSAREATMAYYKQHYVPPGMTIPDGYVDGGRRMVIGKNAAILSTREILVIDRTKDPILRKHLAYAKDPALLQLPTAERAKKLAQYVDKALSPGGNRDGALRAVEEFTTEYANRPVLFGEIEEICQSGVCRHRALLFKMLCDDAGLKSALVRGNYSNAFGSGGHAWNELLLDDGSRVIIDIMNPLPDFKFLPESSPAAKPYVSVKDEPIYPRSKPEKKA